jgi:hypothetical protein
MHRSTNFVLQPHRQVDFGGEHSFDRCRLDHRPTTASTHNNLGGGEAGPTLTNRITAVGWILDRTELGSLPAVHPDRRPRLHQPGQLPARQRPAPDPQQRSRRRVREGPRFNFRYRLPTAAPVFLKAGADWRDNGIATSPQPPLELHRHDRAAARSHLADDAIRGERARIPQWEPSMFVRERQLADPSSGARTSISASRRNYIGTRDVTETSPPATDGAGAARPRSSRARAARRRAHGADRDRELGLGARPRRQHRGATAGRSRSARPSATTPTPAPRSRASYTKSFPSAHLTTTGPEPQGPPELVHQLRPPGHDQPRAQRDRQRTNQTLTINNPSLLPQTATNWDATLEYYFEPVGNLSVGWFHKEIKDYIVSGIDAARSAPGRQRLQRRVRGLHILTSANAGTAFVQGWEFSYQQQFTFLPGLLRTLGLVRQLHLARHPWATSAAPT